ncbi:hypothetical protein PLANPX_4186 [Lacipirellula parvula]|uniref:UBA domain-containing protein n=1 Tax=Lacipirellula parvula TaxID=2650471 RepID=A0A5K7XCQ4_9BACT|nr:hypothetical protein PLANPX_4186 [Lacipirellula parvula]
MSTNQLIRHCAALGFRDAIKAATILKHTVKGSGNLEAAVESLRKNAPHLFK